MEFFPYATVTKQSKAKFDCSLDVRESGTILDSGFHAGESGFQVLDSGILVSGTWIPNSNKKWDLDSLRFWISKRRSPDSTRKNFRIADSLSWGGTAAISTQVIS